MVVKSALLSLSELPGSSDDLTPPKRSLPSSLKLTLLNFSLSVSTANQAIYGQDNIDGTSNDKSQ